MINKHEESATIIITRGIRDLIKLNATYRGMTMNKYIEMLVVNDLQLGEVNKG
jgi:hypothetical protein